MTDVTAESRAERAPVDLRIDGRVALVTGGGRGIGRAICETFAEAGARVAVLTRTKTFGEKTVSALRTSGCDCELFTVDVAEREQVRRAVAAVSERFGGLDIVVHNAADMPYAALGEMSDAQLDQCLNTNLKAAFWLAKDCLPHLKQSVAPRLLFTSSISGTYVTSDGYSAYGASKAGLNGFVRQAAGEFARFGIRVNSVAPGNTLTDAARDHMAATGDNLAAGIPLGTLADATDSAKAMLFLASDAGSHMTGQSIVVDGGQGLGFG